MGFSANARCSDCGYEADLRLGGGMMNHTTFAAWPVTCNHCRAVTTAKFASAPLRCLDCESNDVDIRQPTALEG
jgi:hypothetical protein